MNRLDYAAELLVEAADVLADFRRRVGDVAALGTAEKPLACATIGAALVVETMIRSSALHVRALTSSSAAALVRAAYLVPGPPPRAPARPAAPNKSP